MKRIACLLLGLLALGGCVQTSGEMQDPVTFYYLRAELRYDIADGVISGETIEASGHTGDLEYLLALYFSGPTDDHLRTPFPGDIALGTIDLQHNTLVLDLKGSFTAMEDLEITQACACLAMTCFGITEADAVTICLSDQADAGIQTIEITRDSLILQDLLPETT